MPERVLRHGVNVRRQLVDHLAAVALHPLAAVQGQLLEGVDGHKNVAWEGVSVVVVIVIMMMMMMVMVVVVVVVVVVVMMMMTTTTIMVMVVVAAMTIPLMMMIF